VKQNSSTVVLFTVKVGLFLHLHPLNGSILLRTQQHGARRDKKLKTLLRDAVAP